MLAGDENETQVEKQVGRCCCVCSRIEIVEDEGSRGPLSPLLP